MKRWGTADSHKKSGAISWTVKYGNIADYANNRFPNDGMNEAGLTARTLFYVDGDANETVAPDSKKKELDEDHWVSFVLDNFATVADAVDAIKDDVYLVSVVGKAGSGYSYATPKHLATADATGDSAIFEIRNRQMYVFHGSQYGILTNPPSYQQELDNVAKHQDAAQDHLPSGWSATARFVRADYNVRCLPAPNDNDAATAYGFMNSALATAVMPAGLPAPAEDRDLVKQLIGALTDPSESVGTTTYFQTISDLTNKHYRFKSLTAPADVFFDFDRYDSSDGQPVRVVKRIDQDAQQGWGGDVIPQLVELKGDIYDQAIE